MADLIKSQLSTKSSIPVYLSLPDAARKYNLSERVLTQFVQVGKIEVVQLPSGELLVSANNGSKTKEQIITEESAHLRGQPIGVREAAKKYEISSVTLSRWVKAEYIRAITDNVKRGQKKLVDKADVAYCAKIYKDKGWADVRCTHF